MNEQQPTIGRIVHYRLSDDDVARIKRIRQDSSIVTKHDLPKKVAGPLCVGNPPSAGDVVPLVIVRVWPDEGGPGIPGVNGQCLLDGNDTLWVTSVHEGSGLGQWQWPSRV